MAIELALKSLGIKKNDEVIVPNLTFAATINAVINVGAKPKILDVNDFDFNYNLIKLKKNVNKQTFAIIFVHLFGFPIDIKKTLKNINNKKIFIIEDCAESLGTKISNKHTGNFGDCATFSFFSNKIITTGEGGMINFKRLKNFKLASKIKNQGRNGKKFYWHDEVGSNYRLTNIQAALGITQLNKIVKLLKIRKEIYLNYDRFLSSNKRIYPIHKIISCNFNDISYWYYTIRIDKFNIKKRDRLIEYLKNENIETRPMFYPLSDMKVFKKYHKGGDANSKKWSYCSLSLPTYPGLKIYQIKFVSKKIIEFLLEN